MEKEWVVWIQTQCSQNDVAFFFKQWGVVQKSKNGRSLNGKIYDEMPTIPAQALAHA
jgi:protein gp37